MDEAHDAWSTKRGSEGACWARVAVQLTLNCMGPLTCRFFLIVNTTCLFVCSVMSNSFKIPQTDDQSPMSMEFSRQEY